MKSLRLPDLVFSCRSVKLLFCVPQLMLVDKPVVMRVRVLSITPVAVWD